MPTLRQAVSEGNSGAGIGGNLTLGSPALAGSLLMCILGCRNVSYTGYTIAGFTRVGYDHTSPGILDSDGVGVFARVAAGGEQVISVPLAGGSTDAASGIAAEFTDLGVLASLTAAGADLAGAIATYPAIVPATPGAPAVILRIDWKKAAAPNPGPMTLAAWTLLGDSGYSGFGNRHRLTAFYQAPAAAAASYPAVARSSSGDGADAGVQLTALALGLASGVFPGEPGGGVW